MVLSVSDGQKQPNDAIGSGTKVTIGLVVLLCCLTSGAGLWMVSIVHDSATTIGAQLTDTNTRVTKLEVIGDSTVKTLDRMAASLSTIEHSTNGNVAELQRKVALLEERNRNYESQLAVLGERLRLLEVPKPK